MESAVIKNTDELLALRDKNGAIHIDGDLRVECDVPYPVGKDIARLVVEGNAYFSGNADFHGYAYFRGNVDFSDYAYFRCNAYFHGYADFRGYAYFSGNADFRGYAYFSGNVYFSGNADFRGNAYFSGYAYFRGYADFSGDYLVISGDMFWSQASMPVMPEKYYINRVLPLEHQRDHWQERLGMDLSDGCYTELCRRVLKQILNLLKDDKWSSTERWMLEALRDSKKTAPEWVAEARDENKKIDRKINKV